MYEIKVSHVINGNQIDKIITHVHQLIISEGQEALNVKLTDRTL